MIFGGLMAYGSKRRQKLTAREVNVAALGEAILAFLKWSETAITFDRTDHANHIQLPGHFSLVICATIEGTQLTNVLMDEGSGLNVLYSWAYIAIGLSRAAIRPTNALIYGVIPRARISPLGQSTLPVMFGG